MGMKVYVQKLCRKAENRGRNEQLESGRVVDTHESLTADSGYQSLPA